MARVMKKKYQTGRPYITKKAEQYVLQALKSGVLSMGPFIDRFEKAFAKAVGSKYACAVSSGTAGLHIALIAAGIGPGDEVITSPFSFIASANAILYVGATPVFVDIDPKTYNIDVSKIEKAITARTKAILPVHIFGQPAQMDEVVRIAGKHNLAIIEDACESLRAEYRGVQAGTFGVAGIFAFYANKQMTTGEGGMVVTNSKRMDGLFRSLRNQGRAPNMQWLDHERLGYNYRMDEMSAALGLAQVEQLDFLVEKRKELAAWYTQDLASLGAVETPYTGPGSTHTWFVYVVRIKNKRIIRDKVIEDLAKAGVYTKPYLPSIHLFSFYKEKFGYTEGDYTVSERVSGSTLALPFYIGLTKQDIKHIVAVLAKTLKKHERIQK